MHAVVLVEGESDRLALEALARKLGRDLPAEGVQIVPMGGAQAIARHVETYGSRKDGVRLAGLCDAAEEDEYRRGLRRAGLGDISSRAEMELAGFFVCDADLEDELIRALGSASVERVLASLGDLGAFRTFQKQRAWRDRPVEAQLRRFLGTRGGRKASAAARLVEALEDGRVPRPLEALLAYFAT